MWRIAWLLLVVAALAISAFTTLPPSIAESVQGDPLQQTATRRPTRTPRVTPTRTRRATPTRRATATRRPTRTPTATPDPRVWAGLTDYQDQGSPLPPSSRTFGGGIYMPKSAIQTVDGFESLIFTDALVLGVGAYYPNDYSGNTPMLLPDETGVERVEFTLFGPDGSVVYQITENNKPFCLFGDANGRCTRFDFEDNNCEWEGSAEVPASPILPGFYSLDVTIIGTERIPDPNGGSETVPVGDNWFASFEVQISPDSPCATPREIVHDHFDIAGCCNDSGQRNDEVLSAEVFVTTSGYLGAEVLLGENACSDVSFRLYVDGDFIKKTEFVGPIAGGWDGSGYMTRYVELGEYDPGTYAIRISPEGRVGGCNNGGLGNWEGMVNAYYSQ